MIKGKHIALRALELSDVDCLYIWENDMELWKVSNSQAPFSRFALEQFVLASDKDIYSNRQLRLMIDSKDGSRVGCVDLFDFDPFHLRAGIGIMIREEHRGNGYASESIELMKSYVFEKLMLNQLYCNISADNEVSLKLFENSGFIKVGCKKSWNKISENMFMDEWLLQIIKG